MAGAPPDNVSSTRLAAIRVPGVSRLRFSRTNGADLVAQTWVAFPWHWGLEAGVVAFLDNVPLEASDLLEIDHALQESEIHQAVKLAEQARLQLPLVIELVRRHRPDLQVSGLRFTLDGDIAILAGQISDEARIPALLPAIEQSLNTAVRFEQEGTDGHLFGALGRLIPAKANTTLDDVLQSRFPLEELHHTSTPGGLPRIGATVALESGTGTLVSVSTKRREATVRMSDGSEIIAPLDEISVMP